MTWDPSSLPRGRGRIALVRQGKIAILRLANEAARNAMSVGMMADFLLAVNALKDNPPLALILHGEGPHGFCAGGDLRDVRQHLLNPETAEGMPVVMGRAMDDLAALPAVVISAVEGNALGGGAELSQVADWVVMAESARIGFVHVGLGVTPGWGGARRLMHRVGRARALNIMLSSQRYCGADALSMGLANEVVLDGSAVERAHGFAVRISEASEAAVRGVLSIIRSDDPAGAEAAAFAQLWAGPDHAAALGKVGAGR
jgi:enoyl-CoA hydratase/carnithine racemase